MKEPFLISITVLDRPGITATIMQVLAKYNVNVLDIGQAVIHDALSLGMLVQVPAKDADARTVKEAVQQSAEAMGLAVRFVDIPQQSYQEWVERQGKPRHIVTLLARRRAGRSSTGPRRENSTLAWLSLPMDSSGTRPERRVIWSMFRPLSATTRARRLTW